MSQLELRNLSTNEEVIVPPEGLIFGREGGDADVQLQDPSISRRQAKILVKNGDWILETMAVPAGQRAPRPMVLEEGVVFNIGETEFEVLILVLDEEEQQDLPPQSRANAMTSKNDALSQGKAPPPKPKAAAPAAKSPFPVDKTAPAKAAPKADAKAKSKSSSAEEPASEGGAAGIKGLFVGVPKGIAYYLVNVPKMLVNPLGAVNKAIEEQPMPALAKTELIGYAVPSLVAAAMLPTLGGIVGSLLGGNLVLNIGGIITGLVGGIIGAVIIGFFFHPVLKWIIEKLKGSSTDVSRSNYFLNLQTLSVVTAIPAALGAIISGIRWVNILGPLIGVVATLVTLYAMYKWMVHFAVMNWIPKVILVLGALAALFSLFGVVSMVRVNLAGVGSSSAGSADMDDAMEKLKAEAEALKEKGDSAAEDAKEKMADAKANADEKIAAAKEKSKEALEAAKEKTKEVAKDTKEAAKETAKDIAKETADAKETAKEATKEATKEIAKVVDEKVPAAAQKVIAALPNIPTEQFGNSSFGRFAAHRAQIESVLTLDPTILAKDKVLADMYGEYLETSSGIESKWAKERAKKATRAKLFEYLKQAELFEKTGAHVDELSKKLNIH
jgi:hypothetical protein